MSTGRDVVLEALQGWMRSIQRERVTDGALDKLPPRSEDPLHLMMGWYDGDETERFALYLAFSAGWIQALRTIRQGVRELDPTGDDDDEADD